MNAPLQRQIVWHGSQVSPADRRQLLKNTPLTLWLTGLSASGKSTLAFALEKQLIGLGHACYVLDGDNVRHGLNQDLGFSPAHRTENIRRIAEVARLMNDAGLIVITAFISPYRQDRAMAKQIIGPSCFREIHLATPLPVCEQRDPKGLYGKARAGLIGEFTGISAPYEAPENPELLIDTSTTAIDQALAQLTALVLARATA